MGDSRNKFGVSKSFIVAIVAEELGCVLQKDGQILFRRA